MQTRAKNQQGRVEADAGEADNLVFNPNLSDLDATMQGSFKQTESPKQTISRLTRRKIANILLAAGWWGDIDEIEFLKRVYHLRHMPSTDGRFRDAEGDIRQHRMANSDWQDDWIFSDDRFGLSSGPDEAFLRFAAETVHPDVRGDAQQSQKMVRDMNGHLKRDGWELFPADTVSGYPAYSWRQCDSTLTPTPEGFPLDLEQAIAAIADVLKHRGRARELAVLANSTFSVAEVGYDNWNGGTDLWGLTFALDASLYARLSDSDRTESEDYIKELVSDLFRPFTNDALSQVMITPALRDARGWREVANTWLSGKGMNNQGRVRSDNIASQECDGLVFRSEPEINIYKALKRAGVTFAPLPVFLRGGESYARLEPDFVILKDGRVLVLEVDGR